MWFKKLTGFEEESPENVRNKLSIEGDEFNSSVNNRIFAFGELQVATLEELKDSSTNLKSFTGKLKLCEVVDDVQSLHQYSENKNALFQAASQFNLLEMVSPEVTPEEGIDRYSYDKTQGPACAIACGAGTIFRNYFVKVNGQIGQTANNQIDCLDLIAEDLENEKYCLWEMKNGYALANEKGLLHINKLLSSYSNKRRKVLKKKLKVGIQWNTEVTLSENKQRVSQIYCSALPVAYSRIDAIYWEKFARVILEATYEATLYAAIMNMEKHKSNIVYLTLVGGGAFGNEEYWIIESLEKALNKFKAVPLDVRIVSYGTSNSAVRDLINNFELK